jgi:hypothetical protein
VYLAFRSPCFDAYTSIHCTVTVLEHLLPPFLYKTCLSDIVTSFALVYLRYTLSGPSAFAQTTPVQEGHHQLPQVEGGIMGGQISKLLTSFIWAKKEIRILILGLVCKNSDVGGQIAADPCWTTGQCRKDYITI